MVYLQLHAHAHAQYRTPYLAASQMPSDPDIHQSNSSRRLRQLGAKSLNYTSYPEAGHDSWTETYNNVGMWQWLLLQSTAVPL